MPVYWVSWFTWRGDWPDMPFPAWPGTPHRYWVAAGGERCLPPNYGYYDGNRVTPETLEHLMFLEFRCQDAASRSADPEPRFIASDRVICARIEAGHVDAAWAMVEAVFPDYDPRFIQEMPADWTGPD